MKIDVLAERYGIEHLGFLTLTFADHVLDPREAQRRLNSLLTNVISKRYRDYVCVFERQKSGRIHYHLLVVLYSDIRTGVNFAEFAKGVYKSAPGPLRGEWAFWRSTAPKYKFGRSELLPVRSNKEAISKYVGKYIAKHIGQRNREDKGVRLVRSSKGASVGTTNFAWNSVRSWLWRAKVAKWAVSHGFGTLDQVAKALGPRWAYRYWPMIIETKLSYWPTVAHARADGQDWWDQVPPDVIHLTQEVGRSEPEDPDWSVPRKYTVDLNPSTCRLLRPRHHHQRQLGTADCQQVHPESFNL